MLPALSYSQFQFGALFVLILLLLDFLPAQAQAQIEPIVAVDSPMTAPYYTLGAGDRVAIDVFGFSDYGGEYQVLSDGTIALPLIGTVLVQGMTLTELSEQLTVLYTNYIRRPVISTRLLDARPLRVAIAGEVYRPGAYALASFGESGLPTVTQLIQQAGGITQRADIRRIAVSRSAADGSKQTVEVDLWQLLQAGKLDAEIPLMDGDEIIIPVAAQMDVAEAYLLGSANFSPDTIRVNIAGEVDTPGAIQLPPNASLNQALLSAGGFNNRSRRNRAELIRLHPNGSAEHRTIEVDFSADVNETTNPTLQNNDLILVRRSGIVSVGDFLEPILRPLSQSLGLLNIFGLFD